MLDNIEIDTECKATPLNNSLRIIFLGARLQRFFEYNYCESLMHGRRLIMHQLRSPSQSILYEIN